MAKSFREVAKMFPDANERQVKKAFNDIKREVVNYRDEDEIITIEKNFIDSYTQRKDNNYKVKNLSNKKIENINKNAVLEGKSPNTVVGLSLLLSYKLLNDNSDNFEDFFSTFSTKETLWKAFEEIKNQLDKVIQSNI